MRYSMFFYKQLTKAEVGQAGTHEVYIRLSNGFDYQTFFGNTPQLDENGTITITFDAFNTSKGANSIEKVTLRFVYYSNSNKEKRIPSLGELFRDNNVDMDDIVCLESRNIDGKYTFYLRFFKKGTIQIDPSSFSFTFIENETKKDVITTDKEIFSHQIIYYGAPGTGKSYKIKEYLESQQVSKENIFRTTFHPDSDYATFVGVYKPTMEKPIEKIYAKNELISKLTEMKNGGITYSPQKFGAKYWRSLKQLNLSDKRDILQACGMSDNYTVELDKGMAVGEEYLASSNKSNIIYSFVPQTFLNAYIRAYQTQENVYLVIEEINRGNCAQIFGDLFQLLDRNVEGKSDYTIKADSDLRAYLENTLGSDNEGIKDGELCLPSNLYIFATMNTSDQSLFPIDSAFKRRWDWEYEPIKYKNQDWRIIVGSKQYSWVSFQKIVNERIFDAIHSEDKMLGDYFVNPHNGIITEQILLNKVLFYLWNDVCKEGEGEIFKTSETEEMSFSDLYGQEGQQRIIQMMEYLGVRLLPTEENKNISFTDSNIVPENEEKE
jgi:ATPase associated with various cellular activities AAA_5